MQVKLSEAQSLHRNKGRCFTGTGDAFTGTGDDPHRNGRRSSQKRETIFTGTGDDEIEKCELSSYFSYDYQTRHFHRQYLDFCIDY